MTKAEIEAEVIARGYDYLPTNRISSFVQRSVSTIEALFQWPWSEETKEGVAPVEIKDLRYILSVTDSTQERPLWGTTRQWLLENYPKLAEEGNPVWWFLDNLTLRLFPTSTVDNIVVRYVKKPALLGASSEPPAPAEWHYLFVDQAVCYCLKDRNEYEEARELKVDVEAGLKEMIADQLQRDWQGPRLITRTGYFNEYL